MKILLLLFILTKICLTWILRSPYRSSPAPLQLQQWLSQPIDHFNYLPGPTFEQRYFIHNTYFKGGSAPVILYICGEWVCQGSTQSTIDMAKELGAIVLSLEHRYYGESMPYRDSSLQVDKLRHLNSEQALSDLAYFIRYIVKNKLYGITSNNPWVAIGGSYPGALSAWFRAKYPHLTVGAISSSGVIKAIEQFWQFDEQVFTSFNKSGEFCPAAVLQLVNHAQNQSVYNRIAFQSQFNAQELTTREFMFYFADVLVFQVQYGGRKGFCDSLKGKTLEQNLATVKKIALGVSPKEYGAAYLSNPNLEDVKVARAWYYQSCTEFSWFQTPSHTHPIRSKLLTLDFYKKWCSDIFGSDLWPSIRRTNFEFGGINFKPTNLFMANGVQDPWRWASLSGKKDGVTNVVVDCDGCAHCVDLGSGKQKEIVAVKSQELTKVKEWLNGFTPK